MIFVLPRSTFLWFSRCGSEFSAVNIMKNRLTLKSYAMTPEQLKEKIKLQSETLLTKVAQKEQDPARVLQQIRWLNTLAEFSLIQDNIPMAKEYTQQAISICAKIRNSNDANSVKPMEVEIFTIIAAIEQQLDPVMAIDRYKKVLALQQELTNSQLHYANWLQYVNLALAYLVIADYNAANDIYRSFQNVFPLDTGVFSKKYCLEQSLTNQGIIAACNGNPEQAVILFKQILQDLPNTSVGAAIVNFNLSIIYAKLNDTVANRYHQQAIKIFEKLINIKTHPLCKFLNINITSKNDLSIYNQFIPLSNYNKSNLLPPTSDINTTDTLLPDSLSSYSGLTKTVLSLKK